MKVKRFHEFINEGTRPMTIKDIVDGPGDKKNNFTEGEIKILEKLGFEIILARTNSEVRFTYTNDLHIIVQKKYF